MKRQQKPNSSLLWFNINFSIVFAILFLLTGHPLLSLVEVACGLWCLAQTKRQ
ncbi:hypothetical protein K1I37_14015 [Alicyclobacillus acidoterrestris]|uniref:Uncharacterized protein n=1 Tax=Alicyclobacillus acidoterrestris (strain ATCC 49025 / DSM 3922 / CIP 106132 / NCIMB 13137 / GD3B) TaxID=1356854 RepID=A0A9E6ZP25_ALIAG|nr:hypothetical protein [Alicyclobacillus acidoterrestris]UNO47795.1 hypothetical protein K1I37_14015 [Alicyclobacillus acidoterrestris]